MVTSMASASVVGPVLLGLALLGLGELLHIIGLATPEWTTITSASLGLWAACIRSICGTYIRKAVEVEVCEAFAIIGMLCGLLAGVLALGYLILMITKQRMPHLAIGTAVAGNVAAGSILVCIIVWAASIHPTGATLGYSFALSITGCILLALGANIILLVSCQKS